MRRQEIRQLRRVARHRLCDYAGLLSRAVVAVRIHRVRPAGRTANGGAAARRGPASRRRQVAGGCAGRSRHDADRSKAGSAVIASVAKQSMRGYASSGLLRRFAPKKKQRVKALIFPSFFFAFQAALAMGCKVTSKPSLAIWFTNRFTLISGGRWSK